MLPNGDECSLKDASARSKLDGMGMISYGACTTAGSAQVKVVTIANANWQLKVGSVIGVKYTNTNTYSATTSAPVKLNVNSTGEKQIYYSNTATPTGTNTTAFGYANQYRYYMYDGTYWVFMGVSYHGDTFTSAYCSTAAASAAKTASCSGYVLLAKSYLHVIITNSNTAASALTLNVNGRGAKPIYINSAASSASNHTLPAGSYIVYYDGTNYYFRTDGKLTADIIGDAESVNGHTVGVNVPANAKFTDTTYTAATQSAAGLMSANDKKKLDGIADGATANAGTVTSVATGAGLTGGTITGSGTLKANLTSETKLVNAAADGTETSGRVYPVRLDKNGKLAVNVPWVDTNTHTITSVNGKTGAVTLTASDVNAFGDSTIGAITDANDISLYGSRLFQASACANLPTNASGVYYQVEFFGICQVAHRYSPDGITETWARHYTNSKWYPWVRIDKLTGVKGNAESAYRTGNVNLTPANIGAHPARSNLQVTNNSSYTGTPTAAVSQPVAQIADTDGFIRHQMYGLYNTDGGFYTYLTARRPNGSSATSNNITIGFNANGDMIYGVSAPAAFRSAIGAKVTQSEVSSPAASGTAVAFIDSISQNAQGVITPTKKTVAGATQSAAGLMSAGDKKKLDAITDTKVRIEATTLSAFETALNTRLAAMSDGDVILVRLYANWNGSPTMGSQTCGILTRISSGAYRCAIPDVCASGYYYSGAWHWSRATMESITG